MSKLRITPTLASLTAAAFLLSPAAGQTTTRISVDSQGVQASRYSSSPSISADGRFVAFASLAPLVPGDTNGHLDVYVHDRQTGQVRRISVDPDGLQTQTDSGSPAISADGRQVAFSSRSTRLVSGDTNGCEDVFVHDNLTGVTSRVSVDSFGMQGNRESVDPDISADGRHVKFTSYSDNLAPGVTNYRSDTFVHDRLTGLTTRVNVNSAGVAGNEHSGGGSLSADGRFVAFVSLADNLVAGDVNGVYDVFVHDRISGTTSCISVNSAGVIADAGNGSGSRGASISADGRMIAFSSGAANLAAGDTNGLSDVFVHDRLTGQTSMVSVDSAGGEANGYNSIYIEISANGRCVAFQSFASNLVPNDTNARWDVFVRDLVTGRTERVSVDTPGAEGDRDSYSSSISADGRYVALTSRATNLVAGDTNGTYDVFVRDRSLQGLVLSLSGSCPGPVTLTVRGASAGSQVAFLHGPAGIFVKVAPPCQGLVLGLSPPTLGTIRFADGAGIAAVSFIAPAGLCGRSVQAVDATTCTATSVIVL